MPLKCLLIYIKRHLAYGKEKSSVYKDRVLRIQELEKISKEMEKLDPTMNVAKSVKKFTLCNLNLEQR